MRTYSFAFYPSNIFLQCRTISLALKTDVEFSKRLHKQTNLSLLHYQLGSTSKEKKRAERYDFVKSNQYNQKQNTDATYDSFASDMWKMNCWSCEPSVSSAKNWHCLWFRQSSFHWITSIGVISGNGRKDIVRNIPTPISLSFGLHLRLRLSISSGSPAFLRLINNSTPTLSFV